MSNNTNNPVSGNYNIPINTGNTAINSGGYITWVVPNQTFTVVIGGGGGGGGGDAPKAEEKKKDKGGCACKKCKEYFDYAEPNQADGTLICWSCRHGY